jgi:exopolysaccharide biosynthesis protein
MLILLPACNLESIPPNISPIVPTQTPLPIPSVAPTVDIDTDGWETIAAGFEKRTYIPDDKELAQMLVYRIDPTQYRFRAIYRAGDPLSITEWTQVEPDAFAIINANFYDPQNNVLGLLVSDSVSYGQSYTDRGGTFFVQNGIANLQTFRNPSFQIGALEQAIQAFPVLVENGQQAYFNTSASQLSRRTIIAQDSNGNILLIVTPLIGLSLVDLSAYLPTTDLNLVTAINLDGGGSTMMRIPSTDFTLQSFDPVPAILAVYRR